MTAKKVSRDDNAKTQRSIRNRNRGKAENGADWGEASADLIAQAIALVARAKCAIMFGYTRDGGAFSIRIVGDGEPYNEYVRPTEDIDLYLTGLIEDFKAVRL